MSVAGAAAPKEKAISSEAEFINFVKTYDETASGTYGRLYHTIQKKTIKNIVRIILEQNRIDILTSSAAVGADYDEIGPDGESPLTYCLKTRNHYGFIQIALRSNSKLDLLANTEKGSALYRAVEANSFHFVAVFCLSAHSRFPQEEAIRIINTPRKAVTNQTPLYIACVRKRYNIIEVLLACGADPNSVLFVKQNMTLLHYSATLNHEIIVRLLLSYGADPLITRVGGDAPAEVAKQKGFVKVEALLRRAAAHDVPIETPIESPGEPLRYMFSQRGTTCGPDALFTIFLEADPIREDFQAALDDPRHLALPKSPTGNTSTVEGAMALLAASEAHLTRDRTLEVLAHVIPRYRRMKSLERKPHSRRSRQKSLNAGEGEQILTCARGLYGAGMPIEKTFAMIQKALIENKFGILTKEYNIAAKNIFLGNVVDIPDFSKVFALYLVFGYAIGNSHAVCMFKQNDHWYFGDNEVGLLHKIKEPDFISLFYEGLATGEKQENLAYVVSKDRKTSSKSMMGYICADNVHYPREFGKWGLGNVYPFIECVVLYQTAPIVAPIVARTAGGRRRTRRNRGT